MDPLTSRYRFLRATTAEDFHTCFYCGCIATAMDFAPPKGHYSAYAQRGMGADNLAVPACAECVTLLKPCAMGLVQQRRDFVHTKLAHKYKKAIGVYLKWNEEELAELDFSLHHSISAGLKLGEEAHRRSQYPGFAHEIDGRRVETVATPDPSVMVFGRAFADIKAALDHACVEYAIDRVALADDLARYDNNLEAVILAHQAKEQATRQARELNRQCAAFAKAHNQSRRFVVNAVERYLDKEEAHSVAEALDKLYRERIQHYR